MLIFSLVPVGKDSVKIKVTFLDKGKDTARVPTRLHLEGGLGLKK